MHEKLKHIVESMEFYQSTYPEDVCILVLDTEKVIGYLPGKKIDFKIKVGGSVEEHKHTISVRALKSGKFLREERSHEGTGFAYIATASPIFENGKIIGVITAIISNHLMDYLRTLAGELNASVQELSATAETLTLSSINVAAQIKELSTSADTMHNNISEVKAIVQTVKDIAMHSKILGLNASIEAARSGEHGKGFAVVAKEIQKMAENSTQSADNIAKQLLTLTDTIQYMNNFTTDISAFTANYSTSMHEMTVMYEQLIQMSQSLSKMSEIR